MDERWEKYIKYGFEMEIVGNKKVMKKHPPKKWVELRESRYNGESNFGILTGGMNGIMVVDLDKKDDNFSSKVWWEENVGEIDLVGTLVTETANGGYHIYDGSVNSETNWNGMAIDILSDKRSVWEGKGPRRASRASAVGEN